MHCYEVFETTPTVLEIHGNIVTADIRSHGNDWGIIKLSNQMTRGDPVEVGHDDIHQDHIIFGACVHLVDRL